MTPARPPAPRTAPRAFLILDGRNTVVLEQPVVALGRRPDNDIVVEDGRVSRTHAQLRLRFGHYVVYDLGSTAGTYVNGSRVEECVLRPGDVISLGGVAIIYGEDSAEGEADGSLPARTRPGPDSGTRPLRPANGGPPGRPRSGA
jgi:pSer/pThr/pTyr-binding forkhead associated (FHA) protein